MIPVSYEIIFFIYVLLWFVYLTILWARETWRTGIRDWSLSEGKLCLCNECRYAFLVKPRENTALCPKCNNMCIIKNARFKKYL